MSTPTDHRREHPSTYFVQDRSNEEELSRLQLQDDMVTASMGGVLPEQSDPTIFRFVLDVACGPGGWLMEAARRYPSLSLLVGVDVSNKMIEYAQTQAEAQQLSDRVHFRVMDALRRLEFPQDYFHLVNHRFGGSFLRTWDWPKLLREYQRVTQPGGVIRITESDTSEISSPALTRLNQMLSQAFYQAGHMFAPGKNGPGSELARLLSQYGLRNVQTRTSTLEYRAGTPEGKVFYEDMKQVFRNIVPFFRKWTRVPDDYESLYQQALSEIEQPGFVVKWHLITAWGNRVVE